MMKSVSSVKKNFIDEDGLKIGWLIHCGFVKEMKKMALIKS